MIDGLGMIATNTNANGDNTAVDDRTCAAVLTAAGMLSSALGCMKDAEGQSLVDFELWSANVRAVPLDRLLGLATSSVLRQRIVNRWLHFAVTGACVSE